MHRDAHFGGLFSVMLDYYKGEGKGVQPEFTLGRIERLAILEVEIKENLAAVFLTASEVQKVADAREAYQNLRKIYEVQKPKNRSPQLIADLILSEDEEAEEEIDAIVAEKAQIVPLLIECLSNEQFYDPIFPGYGLAPSLIVKCLGRIGDKRAIISLFEALGQGDFFADDQILKAFQTIGSPAKTFLLKVAAGRPLNEDNERAAIALLAFKEDPEVAAYCFNLLKNEDIQQDVCLSTYFALACVGLQDESLRQEFQKLASQDNLNKMLREDMKSVILSWSEKDLS
jgi:HEAT repeat protein